MLDMNGEVVNLNEMKNNRPFFRKMSIDPNELIIAKRLMKSPHPHIVKIYHVGKNFYDMELVKTSKLSKKDCISQRVGLISAKNHMHRHGIVYIDWKVDNMGRDAKGDIKIFDFDMSGLLSRRMWFFNFKNNWNRLPRLKGFLLRNAERRQPNATPITLDNYIFDNFFLGSVRPRVNR